MKFYTSTFFLILTIALSFSVLARESDTENLSRAKFKLISGDISMTQYYLDQVLEDKLSQLTPVKKRYQAIIEFIKGNHKKSNLILNEIPEADGKTGGIYYGQICLLKILNAIAINDIDVIKVNQKLCEERTLKFSSNDQFWLDTVIKLKLKNKDGLKKNLILDNESNLSEEEMTKLWLKTGLYLNREQDFLNLLTMISDESFQSKRIAELIGFMYLRHGNNEKALAFIEGIDSANAENIRGNINLQKKEYELAFGHFKLSLQKKQDSLNALERSIPLTWILHQYDEGLVMLNNPTLQKIDYKKIRSLKIAYLTKLKKFEEADKEIAALMIQFNNRPPNDVNIIASYLSLMRGSTEKNYDRRLSEELAEKACRSFDGLNCWIALKLTQWENLGKTIKRDEETFIDKSISLESMKLPVNITPLVENKIIDQANIEEMDSKLVRLK